MILLLLAYINRSTVEENLYSSFSLVFLPNKVLATPQRIMDEWQNRKRTERSFKKWHPVLTRTNSPIGEAPLSHAEKKKNCVGEVIKIIKKNGQEPRKSKDRPSELTAFPSNSYTPEKKKHLKLSSPNPLQKNYQ